MKQGTEGFSLVEILVAIVILSVGLLALAQSSGAVTTMIARGKQDTQAAMAAQTQLEVLRRVANTTTPKCTALASGSSTGPAPGTTTTWTVGGSGGSRTVTVSVAYRIGKRTRTVATQSVLGCL